MNNPFVSIIIPAKNARKTIRQCLSSVLRLAYQPYEVMVVNDGSGDETAEILSAYPRIKVLNTPAVGPAEARNIAIEQAAGEFIAFTDADCSVDPHWLSELLKGFTDDKVVGVGGIQKSPDDESGFGKRAQDFLRIFGFVSGYMQSAQEIKETRHNPTCNAMYRKSVLKEAGGFLAGLWPGEDVELDYRLKKQGYSLKFNPRAVVFHYRPGNFRDFSKMMFRYGRAQGRLVKKYGIFRKVHFAPVLVLILMLASLGNIFLGLSALALMVIFLFIKSFIGAQNPFLMLGVVLAAVCAWNAGFICGLIFLDKQQRK